MIREVVEKGFVCIFKWCQVGGSQWLWELLFRWWQWSQNGGGCGFRWCGGVVAIVVGVDSDSDSVVSNSGVGCGFIWFGGGCECGESSSRRWPDLVVVVCKINNELGACAVILK
ncbi:hypothetical protein Adt_10176 [Abeliophyllum distichum]|uniref:Transmembrane protein n=1 Tax=Abeliophyllum distichum TaxID=126358 RepID=A0ABD1UJF6_9LAMI